METPSSTATKKLPWYLDLVFLIREAPSIAGLRSIHGALVAAKDTGGLQTVFNELSASSQHTLNAYYTPRESWPEGSQAFVGKELASVALAFPPDEDAYALLEACKHAAKHKALILQARREATQRIQEAHEEWDRLRRILDPTSLSAIKRYRNRRGAGGMIGKPIYLPALIQMQGGTATKSSIQRVRRFLRRAEMRPRANPNAKAPGQSSQSERAHRALAPTPTRRNTATLRSSEPAASPPRRQPQREGTRRSCAAASPPRPRRRATSEARRPGGLWGEEPEFISGDEGCGVRTPTRFGGRNKI